MGDYTPHTLEGQPVSNDLQPNKLAHKNVVSSVLHQQIKKDPPKIVSGKGNYLIDSNGDEKFDASGGAAVVSIGHGNTRVKDAVIKQMDQVSYCYLPFFTTEPAEKLAKELVDSTSGNMSKVFIVSSGTEANEAAIKLSRQYFAELPEPQMSRTRFIGRKQSYHGNTLGSLSIGYHQARRAIYEPILSQNTSQVSPCYPYRDQKEGESSEAYVKKLAQELEDEFQKWGPNTVCAFIAETMSGTSLGFVPPAPGYLKAMQEVCHRHGALFILDEVMVGMGRTGTMHAWEQEGVVPDLQTVAKGLGAGYIPIGALLVGQKVADTLFQGSGAFVHSQTYQGHPVACAAAYEVQQIIKEEGLLANATRMGDYLGKLLQERLGGHKNIGDIRGRGLAWGIEFVEDKASKKPFPSEKKISGLIHLAGLQAKEGISFIPGSGNADGKNGDVVLISPAYNMTRADVEIIVDRTEKVVREVLG
ncbi:PLP-dependent transferase [Pleomassaria siparia CBS 279.74]|uniref:PLP-dependent transferase n=1 Tax=Pleomassaria siparia CBS 279.74 TaxID=1314801 RepID=A0A6G1K6G7_9PLEO|nr:PLP-dependent transferase [Pleomassaria siparia CBS 279.74]